MAAQQPPPPTTLGRMLHQLILERTAVVEKATVIAARGRAVRPPVPYEGELTDVVFNLDSVTALLITEANGSQGLIEQRVNVEYIRNEQRLVIPYALGMSPLNVDGADVPFRAALANRYLRVSTLSYDRLEQIVYQNANLTAVLTAVDALPLPNPPVMNTSWNTREFYVNGAGERVSRANAAMLFGMLSQALQFNCDIRDTNKLNNAEMRLADSTWQGVHNIPQHRLDVKLMPYTLQSIAALNVTAVGDNALAAWTRAFGLGAGILPAKDSGTHKEYRYVMQQPLNEQRTLVFNYEADCQYDLYSVSLNLIAMFGLQHLNKDHTFKSNDSNMERICTSYIQTIRTMVSVEMMEQMKGHLEILCRTVAHPFGLGQTYFVAMYMSRYGALSTALAKRVDVAPPPVQRVMVIRAAEREWAGVPAGRSLSAMFYEDIAEIKAEYDRIMSCPPAYSGLHNLYGLAEMRVISDAAKVAIDVLMPAVYGYSLSQHMDEQRKKDGLAHALCLDNVARDRKAVVNMYLNLWNKYMDGVDQSGIVQFAEESLRIRNSLLNQGYQQGPGAVPP